MLGIYQQSSPVNQAGIYLLCLFLHPALIAHDTCLDNHLEGTTGEVVHQFEGVRVEYLLIDGKCLGSHLGRTDGVGGNGIVNLFYTWVPTQLHKALSLHFAQGDHGIGPLDKLALYQRHSGTLLGGQHLQGKGLQLSVRCYYGTDIKLTGATHGLGVQHLVGAMNVDDIGLGVASLLVEGFAVIGHYHGGTLS